MIWIGVTYQNWLDPQHKGRSKGRETIITVERGNLDRFFTFRIILKIVPVIFLPIFLHKKSYELWYFLHQSQKLWFCVGSTIFFF